MCSGHIAFVPDPESRLLPERCSECHSSVPMKGDSDHIYEYLHSSFAQNRCEISKL